MCRLRCVWPQLVRWEVQDSQSFHPSERWIRFVPLAGLSLGWRLPLTRVLLLLLLLHMALQHRRFGELLGVTTPLLAAAALAPQLCRRSVPELLPLLLPMPLQHRRFAVLPAGTTPLMAAAP